MRYSICLAVLVLTSVASAHTIWVPDDHATIQGAIDAAGVGDEIVVRAGTYVELLAIDGKTITVRSERGPLVTTIDGNFLGSVVTIANAGSGTVLEGFTLTNGTGTGSPAPKGGGIHLTNGSPEIRHCVFEGNTALRGGGMYCNDHASPLVTGCTFTNLGGGAIYGENFSSLTIEDSLIDGNEGAGVELWDDGDLTLHESVISNNDGAGIAFRNILDVLIEDCAATNNGGPGMAANVSAGCVVTRCDFSHNGGSGISGYGTLLTVEQSTLLHNGSAGIDGYYVSMNVGNSCLVGNGKGGIIAWNSGVDVDNCTIARNTSAVGAGGIDATYDYDNGVCTVGDSILWDNTGIFGPEIRLAVTSAWHSGTLTVEYSDVKGGQTSVQVESGSILNWGAGMIDADPLFVDAGADDFRLQQDPVPPGVINPCVDAGSPLTAVPPGSTRADWVLDAGIVDMGFHYAIPFARAEFRNDGLNPASYSAETLPVLGGAYVGKVDLGGTTSHSLALLAAYASPLTFHLPGGQVALVNGADPNGELMGWPSASGPIAVFTVPLPLDYALAGLGVFTQAVHVGGVQPFALSNAQDLVLGL